MGDNGNLYVNPELVPIYRDEVVPLASILTPNQFEAEQLAEMHITSQATAVKAMSAIHTRGVRDVVITSMTVPESSDSLIHVIASRRTPRASSRPAAQGDELFACELPRLPYRFTGTGDLLSALTLAWSTRGEAPSLRDTVVKTLSTLQAVVKRTYDDACGSVTEAAAQGREAKARACRRGELRLVQSMQDIVSPPAAAFTFLDLQQ